MSAGRGSESMIGKSKMSPSALDMSIMGTNDSSIVSKRSVERIYLPRPHFFRHFVNKPKRRSPLINRGYWLRMKVIEDELEEFLSDKDPKPKVVVNLGCGYDPLPFSMLAKSPDLTDGVLFVDVDYQALIEAKAAMVQASSEIMELLGQPRDTSLSKALMVFRHYVALGCDLSHPGRLESLLKEHFDVANSAIFFVAEVSVTYMAERDADNLIQWASSLGSSKFCILEQCLPWGPEHPFAETMLKHFAKLGTRLRSLESYPTIEKQKERFTDRGWKSVRALSLWQKWSAPDLLSSEERIRMNTLEPFDEWEEFALFGQHYFILIAASKPSPESPTLSLPLQSKTESKYNGYEKQGQEFWLQSKKSKNFPVRTHGALFPIDSSMLCHHGGYGPQRRLDSSDVISELAGPRVTASDLPSVGERMCHTVTSITRASTALLVGGRTSPDRALSDCWLKFKHGWKKTESLPHGIYRHCATELRKEVEDYDKVSFPNNPSHVLVYGGKTTKETVSDKWYLYTLTIEGSEAIGGKWTSLRVEGIDIDPRFGATICQHQSFLNDPGMFSGLVMGGMRVDGLLAESAYVWTIEILQRTIRFEPYIQPGYLELCRFGAQGGQSAERENQRFYLVGGIASAKEEPLAYRPIISLNMSTISGESESDRPFEPDARVACTSSRFSPILVGHSVACMKLARNGLQVECLVIAGGAATCFSFGSYRNKSIWTFHDGKPLANAFVPSLPETKEVVSPIRKSLQKAPSGARPAVRNVQITSDNIVFEDIVRESRPNVLQNLDLGSCIDLWSCSYLKAQVSNEKIVSVHISEERMMNFREKNFTYTKIPFNDFVDLIEAGGSHYLRALSTEAINRPANFWTDFPELANDFVLPEALSRVIKRPMSNDASRLHSAVFRLSGPVAMWLHYDVMANVLCQINGKKRLLLFPPSDVTLLGISPGQSSSSLNMFDSDVYQKHPELSQVHPHEVILHPGEVLFIPAFWLHTAEPIEGVSMAVNIFFRDLDTGYANGRDTYGNRDLHAYEEGRRDVKKALSRFKGLPRNARQFYLRRLAQELELGEPFLDNDA